MGRLRAGELPGPPVPVGHVWTRGVQLLRQVVRPGRPRLIRPRRQTGKPDTGHVTSDLQVKTGMFCLNINNSKYLRFCIFPRTTMQPGLSCLSVLGSLGRRWRSRTTFPTWWAATASIGSPPSECWEERKYSRGKSLFPLDRGFLEAHGGRRDRSDTE